MTYQTPTYQTLAKAITARLEIKKSEFIAHAYPVNNREDALFHVEQLRQDYPDARHHCWAYIIGDPSNTTSAGYDDDGEPSNTAGKPILNVLQHKDIGDVVVIVVRYFGGIKLGAGGLTRAYAGATQAVVDEAMAKNLLTPFVPMTTVQIATDFANESQVRYVVDTVGGVIKDVAYGKRVTLTLSLPEPQLTVLAEKLGNDGEIITRANTI